jgi:glycine/D-amino acid oxidase-like deaminating enzyme
LTWSERVKKYGLEEAITISNFELAHRSFLLSLANKYNLKCDLLEVETVDAYYNVAALENGIAAASKISEHIPDLIYQIYSAAEAQKLFQVSKDCVGAIVYPAAQLSSYKFVTQLAEILVDKGVNLQTETPVTEIVPTTEGQWLLVTPRGSIIASKVVHATNGYASYLLPSFQSLIKPTRGFMTAQRPTKCLLDVPLHRSYSFIYGGGENFDYLIQEPAYDGGKLMLGGGLLRDPERETFDDAEIPELMSSYLGNQLHKVLRGEAVEDTVPLMCWSGIMGFSNDNLPWIGEVPEGICGGREQWISAGYTGDGTFKVLNSLTIGMTNAILCAEALAMMMLGNPTPTWFPRSYLVTEERMQRHQQNADAGSSD